MMRFNLLPKHERGRSKPRADGMRFAWIGLGALIVLVILLTVFNVRIAALTSSEEADLFQRVLALRVEQAELSRVRSDNQQLVQTHERLEKLLYQNRNEATSHLLADVAAAVPKDAWLAGLYVNTGRDVFARGHAAETGDLSALLRQLTGAARVQNVQLSSMDRVSGTDGYRRDFTLSLTLEGWEQ